MLDAVTRTVRSVGAFISLTVFVLIPVVVAPAASASMRCVYHAKDETMDVETGGEAVRLSVGGNQQILVNASMCGESDTYDESFHWAYTYNTDFVNVSGSGIVDDVTIDQNGDGGTFPEEISFVLALDEDPGDTLRLELTRGEDQVAASPYSLGLYGGSGGLVELGGVDEVVVLLGEGDDVVEATQPGVDPLPVPITAWGGDGSDELTGGSGDDHLYGEAGQDRLDARGGSDELLGGADNDHMYGRDGSDRLDGEDGTDVLIGGSGKDWCWFAKAYRRCDPMIGLRQRTAAAGSIIVAYGSGWYPENGPISIAFDGVDPSTVVRRFDQAGGSFEDEPLKVPPEAAGEPTRTVQACQLCTDVVVNEDSTIFEYATAADMTLDIRPARGEEGDRVFVSGSGWAADEEVQVFLDSVGGTPVARETPGDDMRFATWFIVEGVSAGDHRVIACQRCGIDGELVQERPFLVVAVGGGPSGIASPSTSPASDDRSWPKVAIVGVFVAVALVLAMLLVASLSMIWPKSTGPSGSESVPPSGHVEARLSDRPPSVSVTRVSDGSSDHVVQLVPVRDPGVLRVEEVSVR